MYALAIRRLEVLKDIKNIFSISGHEVSDKEAMIVLSALSSDDFLAKRFIHYPDMVMSEIAKHDYNDKVFIPCNPLELSSWCHDDKMYLSHPRLAHSLRYLEKNNAQNVFGIYLNCPKNALKIGYLKFLYGKTNNFCGLVDGLVISSKYSHIASKIQKKYGNFWSIDPFMPFIKSSAEYRITISKLGINETVDAADAKSALSSVLDKAWANAKESGFFRRKPPDYVAETYLENPEFIPDVIKLASSWPPSVGSRVRVRPSNGMPGGKIGIVVYSEGNFITVDFNGSKIKYKTDDPRTISMIDTDLN